MAWTSMTQQLAAQLRPGGPPWAGVKEHSSHLECVSRIVACGKHASLGSAAGVYFYELPDTPST
jgi:hypothetical protein